MTEPAGLHDRVTRLEEEVAQVRYLARKTDRDVSDFRAVLHGHTGVLNAIRENQLEQGQILAVHTDRLDALDSKVNRLEHKVDIGFAKMDENFAKVDENFAAVEKKFEVVRTGMNHITGLLTTALKRPEEP